MASFKEIDSLIDTPAFRRAGVDRLKAPDGGIGLGILIGSPKARQKKADEGEKGGRKKKNRGEKK